MRIFRRSGGLARLFLLACAAQSIASAQGLRKDRITAAIDDRVTVVSRGSRHPLALPQFDAGAAAASERLDRMILVLSPDSAQQEALERLLHSQQDEESPLYHQWLTPESFGRQFGISDSDLGQVSNWLARHGFHLDEIVAGRRAIVFSGTVAQVELAFHTRMRHYTVNGERHLANAASLAIPAALAGVVHGIASLHDFRRKPMHTAQVISEFT